MVFGIRWDQRGIHANAPALRCGVDADVNCGMGGVGQAGALVEAEGGVVIAQEQSSQAASFEFLAQTAREGEGDIFFRELVGEGSAAFVASVARVYHGKIMPNAGGCGA